MIRDQPVTSAKRGSLWIRIACQSHEVEFRLGSSAEWDIPLVWLSWEKHPRHVITWHHPSFCLVPLGWPTHSSCSLTRAVCWSAPRGHWTPDSRTRWRWIPNSPSWDSALLAVNRIARNEVKWHYLHNMGGSSIFINGDDSLHSSKRGSVILGKYYK